MWLRLPKQAHGGVPQAVVVRQKVAVARFAQSVDSLTLGEVYHQALARQCVHLVVKGFCES